MLVNVIGRMWHMQNSGKEAENDDDKVNFTANFMERDLRNGLWLSP